MKKIIVKPLFHRDELCFGIYFPYDPELAEVVKKLPARKYSSTHRCWYLLQKNISLAELCEQLEQKAAVELQGFENTTTQPEPTGVHLPEGQSLPKKELNPVHKQALRMMEQKLNLRGYSPNTHKTYLSNFTQFLFFYYDSHPADLEELEIRNYLLYLVEQKKISRSHQNQAINAIKFFYEKVLLQARKVYYIERPMKERRLPEVLSEEEVMAIFSALDNLKHQCLLMLTYSAGLRRSEVLNLRIGDVDLDRNIVFIRNGKGRKDRQSILASTLAPIIARYLKEYAPKFWLFEGQKGDRYTESSLRSILSSAVKKAGLKKRVRLHMLRHSFATHLLESGTSTRYIQVLLGHESPVTTELYAQVTRFGLDKIKSPLDNIVATKIIEKRRDD